MKVAILFALAACACAASVSMNLHGSSEFEAFKAQFNVKYESQAEEAKRFAVFQENLKLIAAQNAKFEAGESSFTMGVNQFADLTADEFDSMYLSEYKRTTARNVVTLPEAEADEVDWRTKNAVTPIKNQGQCGSCWSFSTTGSVEGAHAIATGNLVSLSEQQLMDCSTAEGNMGCNGGLMDNAFKYIMKNGGIDLESDYPYTARDGTCNKVKAAKHAATITSFQDVAHNNQDQLAAAVAKGPVSVAIEADKSAFQLYKSGIFDDAGCGTQLDHGVLVVGYGTEGAKNYWIVKNSWGESWGDQGYIMIERTESGPGICGIAMEPSYPTGAGVAAPLDGHYEDPNPSGTCQAGEEDVRVTGLGGSFCSPSCSATSPCPTDVPSGTTANPECVLEMPGHSSPTNCALICSPSAEAGQDGCPDKATCKPISGTGVCTYDS